jgi:hypothetical protein
VRVGMEASGALLEVDSSFVGQHSPRSRV